MEVCRTCKYAEWEQDEKGWFVEGCKIGMPSPVTEDDDGDITECPEHEEVRQ